MAVTATRTATPALRGSAGLTRKPDRRTATDDLRDELHALTAERDAIRVELARLRDLLTYAAGIDGWHIALGVRDRLASLAIRLERRGAA